MSFELSGILHWLKTLGRRGEASKLHVEGVIADKRIQTPRTRLGPTPAAEEAVFELEIERAWRPNRPFLPPEEVFPPTFAGPLELFARFDVGDRVRIVCTTLTGSLIESMERIDS